MVGMSISRAKEFAGYKGWRRPAIEPSAYATTCSGWMNAYIRRMKVVILLVLLGPCCGIAFGRPVAVESFAHGLTSMNARDFAFVTSAIAAGALALTSGLEYFLHRRREMILLLGMSLTIPLIFCFSFPAPTESKGSGGEAAVAMLLLGAAFVGGHWRMWWEKAGNVETLNRYRAISLICLGLGGVTLLIKLPQSFTAALATAAVAACALGHTKLLSELGRMQGTLLTSGLALPLSLSIVWLAQDSSVGLQPVLSSLAYGFAYLFVMTIWAWYVVALLRSLGQERVHQLISDRMFERELLELRTRKKEEANAAQTKELLERQTEFLATMSHELRTPLSCIVGLSRMLGSSFEFEPTLASDMGTIERVAVQLLKTVDEGLTYVRKESIDSDMCSNEVDMRDLLRDVRALSHWLAQQHSNDFEFVRAEKMPKRLYFDEQKARQILINLIANAARYCSNGKITVAVIFKMQGSTPMLVWLVEDTGRGMDDEELRRFFEPFVKSRDSQGLGLGLPLVRRHVNQLGGQLNVLSKKGAGTKVRVAFPVHINENPSLRSDMEECEDYLDTQREGPPSVPMALLSPDELSTLDIETLRKHIELGRISEIEQWHVKARLHKDLSYDAQRLVAKVESLIKRVDLKGLSDLLDQMDSPASFI